MISGNDLPVNRFNYIDNCSLKESEKLNLTNNIKRNEIMFLNNLRSAPASFDTSYKTYSINLNNLNESTKFIDKKCDITNIKNEYIDDVIKRQKLFNEPKLIYNYENKLLVSEIMQRYTLSEHLANILLFRTDNLINNFIKLDSFDMTMFKEEITNIFIDIQLDISYITDFINHYYASKISKLQKLNIDNLTNPTNNKSDKITILFNVLKQSYVDKDVIPSDNSFMTYCEIFYDVFNDYLLGIGYLTDSVDSKVYSYRNKIFIFQKRFLIHSLFDERLMNEKFIHLLSNKVYLLNKDTMTYSNSTSIKPSAPPSQIFNYNTDGTFDISTGQNKLNIDNTLAGNLKFKTSDNIIFDNPTVNFKQIVVNDNGVFKKNLIIDGDLIVNGKIIQNTK